MSKRPFIGFSSLETVESSFSPLASLSHLPWSLPLCLMACTLLRTLEAVSSLQSSQTTPRLIT